MACQICGREKVWHGSEHFPAPGTYLSEIGCHDGVRMDDDEHGEGWADDTIYPPCPHNPLCCKSCGGSGDAKGGDCPDCNGTGWKNGEPPDSNSEFLPQFLDNIADLLTAPQAGCAKEGWQLVPKLSRETWARIACEWDEDNKGQCRCAKGGVPIEDMCSGCVGVADTVIATLNSISASPPLPVAEREWQEIVQDARRYRRLQILGCAPMSSLTPT